MRGGGNVKQIVPDGFHVAQRLLMLLLPMKKGNFSYAFFASGRIENLMDQKSESFFKHTPIIVFLPSRAVDVWIRLLFSSPTFLIVIEKSRLQWGIIALDWVPMKRTHKASLPPSTWRSNVIEWLWNLLTFNVIIKWEIFRWQIKFCDLINVKVHDLLSKSQSAFNHNP